MKPKHKFILAAGILLTGVVTAFVFKRPLIDANAAEFRLMTTHSNLAIVGDSIAHWTLKQGHAPSDKENFSILKMKIDTPTDGWDNFLKYKNMENQGSGKFLLYSTGPDGIDKRGEGDDIIYRQEQSGK